MKLLRKRGFKRIKKFNWVELLMIGFDLEFVKVLEELKILPLNRKKVIELGSGGLSNNRISTRMLINEKIYKKSNVYIIDGTEVILKKVKKYTIDSSICVSDGFIVLRKSDNKTIMFLSKNVVVNNNSLSILRVTEDGYDVLNKNGRVEVLKSTHSDPIKYSFYKEYKLWYKLIFKDGSFIQTTDNHVCLYV